MRKEPIAHHPLFGKKPEIPRFSRGMNIAAAACIALLISGLTWFAVRKGMDVKQDALSKGEAGYRDLIAAGESLKSEQYAGSLDHFDAAYQAFGAASENLTFWGDTLIDLTRFIPGFSSVASG
jgi:hypothetical protein